MTRKKIPFYYLSSLLCLVVIDYQRFQIVKYLPLFFFVWKYGMTSFETMKCVVSVIQWFFHMTKTKLYVFLAPSHYRFIYRTKIQTTNKLWFEGSILRKWREKGYKKWLYAMFVFIWESPVRNWFIICLFHLKI